MKGAQNRTNQEPRKSWHVLGRTMPCPQGSGGEGRDEKTKQTRRSRGGGSLGGTNGDYRVGGYVASCGDFRFYQKERQKESPKKEAEKLTSGSTLKRGGGGGVAIGVARKGGVQEGGKNLGWPPRCLQSRDRALEGQTYKGPKFHGRTN